MSDGSSAFTRSMTAWTMCSSTTTSVGFVCGVSNCFAVEDEASSSFAGSSFDSEA